MFVQGNKLAECLRSQAIDKDHVRRAISFEYPMGHKPFRRAFRFNLLRRLAERERLGLRKDVGEEHRVVATKRVERVSKCNEVAGDYPRSLMDQLVKRVLTVGTRFAPVNRPGLIVDYC